MAETLGMLCDKLTIVQLKQYHTLDDFRSKSLAEQITSLKEEINEFIVDAVSGKIPPHKLTFDSNKVFKTDGNVIPDVSGDFGEIFFRLSEVNCELWHEQEKVYEFENVPAHEKDTVVKKLALLNLERNSCIDNLNKNFLQLINIKSTEINAHS